MIKSSALSALLKQAVAQGTHDSRYCLINVGGVLSNWFCDSQRKEIEVFESEQDAKTHPQGQKEDPTLCPLFFRPLYAQRCPVGHHRGQKNQNHIFRIPAHVKIVAGNQQNRPPEFVGYSPVQDEYNGQKNRKRQGVKQHGQTSFPYIQYPNRPLWGRDRLGYGVWLWAL